MKAEEIVKLTRKGIAELLESRRGETQSFSGHEKRRAARWPFPGQVELQPVDEPQRPPCFADCRDLSEGGLGMRCDEPFELGTRLELSLHLPEVTFYGHAIVRYCMRTPKGHMLGVEFEFEQ